MNELTQWGGSLEPRRPSLAARRAAQNTVENIRQTGLDLKGEAALWGLGMELIADLDTYRHALAQGNPELNAVLVRFELGFAAGAEKTIRNRNSPLRGL